MKPLSLAAGLILMSGVLVGCGGGDAPTDASKADFCETYVDTDALTEEDATGADVRDWADNLEETGTPEDISDDARKGFEVFLEAAKDIDEDAKADDIEEPDVSAEEEKQLEAFGEYVGTTCTEEMQKKMEEEMPELPDMEESTE